MKINDSNLCIKCNVKANARHVLLNYVFQNYFINSLAQFLDKTYNNSQPDLIFLKENFYLFKMHYDIFSINDYLQLTLLILISKERAMKINNDECLIRWNEFNYFSQSFIAKLTYNVLENLGKTSILINQYLDR